MIVQILVILATCFTLALSSPYASGYSSGYSARANLPPSSGQTSAQGPLQKASPADNIDSLAPITDSDKVNWQVYAQQILGTPDKIWGRKLDAQSPTAKAALDYFDNAVDIDSCGAVAKAYLKIILSGGSMVQASVEAASTYIRNHNDGVRPKPGSPCENANIAFREALVIGQDPLLSAALTYMNSYRSDSPCWAASRDYVDAVVNGNARQEEAQIVAAKSFTRQIQNLASQGKATVDPVCSSAAQSFAATLNVPSSSPTAAAFQTFFTEAMKTGKGFDPVCNSAAEAYFDASTSGAGEDKSSEAAAIAYLDALEANPDFDMKSPCGRAARAYMAAVYEW